jgi:hypothetical protein
MEKMVKMVKIIEKMVKMVKIIEKMVKIMEKNGKNCGKIVGK